MAINLTTSLSNITVNTTSNVVTVSSTPVNVQLSATSIVSNTAVRQAISVSNVSGYGNLTYDSSNTSNGVIQYIGVSNSDITTVISDNPANVRTAISNTDPVLYSSATGVISLNNTTLLSGQTTSNLTEGTNLYWTTDRGNTTIGAYTGSLENLTGNITTTANIQGATLKSTGATGLVVTGNATIGGNLDVTENVIATSNLTAVGGSFSGNVTIGGNLDVTGNINASNVVDLFVEDRNITLQFGTSAANIAPTANSQIFIDRGTSANTFLLWNESNDKWGFSNDGTNIDYLLRPAELDVNLIPTTSNTYTLGNATNQWDQIHASNIQVQYANINVLDSENANNNIEIRSALIPAPGGVAIGSDGDRFTLIYSRDFIGNLMTAANITSNELLTVNGNMILPNGTANITSINANDLTVANTIGTLGVSNLTVTDLTLTNAISNANIVDQQLTINYGYTGNTSGLANAEIVYERGTETNARLFFREADTPLGYALRKSWHMDNVVNNASVKSEIVGEIVDSSNAQFGHTILHGNVLSINSHGGANDDGLIISGTAGDATSNSLFVYFDGSDEIALGQAFVADDQGTNVANAAGGTVLSVSTQGGTNDGIRVSGNIIQQNHRSGSAGRIEAAGNITTTANVQGSWFVGNIDGTTADFTGNVSGAWFVGNVDATQIDVVNMTVTGNVTSNANIDGNLYVGGTVFATAFDGDGSDLTSVRAETVEEKVINKSGGLLPKGTPVFATGNVTADALWVDACDAANAATMPCIGVLATDLANDVEGRAIIAGKIAGVDTSSFSPGDEIYVGVGGGYTNTHPAGEANIIQFLGIVTESSNTGGGIVSIESPHDESNLDNGNIFVGDANNQTVTADLSNFTYEISSDSNISTTANIQGDYSIANTMLTTLLDSNGNVTLKNTGTALDVTTAGFAIWSNDGENFGNVDIRSGLRLNQEGFANASHQNYLQNTYFNGYANVDSLSVRLNGNADFAGNINVTDGGDMILGSASNITLDSTGIITVDNIQSSASANMALKAQNGLLEINRTSDSTDSRIIDVSSTGHDVLYTDFATANVTTQNVPGLLVSGAAFAGGNTLYLTSFFPAGPGIYGWFGKQTSATAFTSAWLVGTTAETAFATLANGNDRGWISYETSGVQMAGLPANAYVTAITANTITFSENFTANNTNAFILRPGAHSSTQEIHLRIRGDESNTSIPYTRVDAFRQDYLLPDTISNVTLDYVSYGDSTVDMANTTLKQISKIDPGTYSSIKTPQSILIGENATPDVYSGGTTLTSAANPIGVVLEKDGLTSYSSDDSTPFVKFLINNFTSNSLIQATDVPSWATIYASGNATLDNAQLAAPTFNFKTIEGAKGDSGGYILNDRVVGRITWNAPNTPTVGIPTGSDLIYAPAALTVQTATDQANTAPFGNISAMDMYLQTSYRTSYRNGTNGSNGGIPRTFIANQAGNTVIAAKTDGRITLKPVRDYGDPGDSTSFAYNRYPNAIHDYHTFLSAEFANTSAKSGTVITIQPDSGETGGSTDFNYDSKGNATLRFQTHLANNDPRYNFDIIHDEANEKFIIASDSTASTEHVSIESSGRVSMKQVMNLNPLSNSAILALTGNTAGDVVYGSDVNRVCYYDGTNWVTIDTNTTIV